MALGCAGTLQEESSSQAGADSPNSQDSHAAIRDLDVERLQDELQTALNKISSVEREAELAKQAAGTELVLMRRQLTSCQAALAEAEQVLQPSTLPAIYSQHSLQMSV